MAGDDYEEVAQKWGAEIADLVRQYGGGNNRLAIDRCSPEGLFALNAQGIEVGHGESLIELARCIKSDEEIKAMRCAIHACEQSIELMRTKSAAIHATKIGKCTNHFDSRTSLFFFGFRKIGRKGRHGMR